MLLKNPPARVYYPLIAFQTLYLLMLMRCGGTQTVAGRGLHSFGARPADGQLGSRFWHLLPHRVVSRALITLAILGLGLGQYKASRDSHRALAGNRQLHADIVSLNLQDDDLLVCWGCCFPYESILPLETLGSYRNIHLYCLGWPQQSPVNEAVKKHFGFQDLTRGLVNHPHVYLAGTSANSGTAPPLELDYYQTFIREHYNINLNWQTCFEGQRFSVYKPVLTVAKSPTRPSTTAAR
jgi:hypothetical protein